MIHLGDITKIRGCVAPVVDAIIGGSPCQDLSLAGKRAGLAGADLSGAKNISYIPMACPDSGAFTAWKKARGKIVKLLVPENAKRSSAAGRKCRCDKAVVLAIENIDGTDSGLSSVASGYDPKFLYTVNETVTVSDFCENRFLECASGIHFFMNRKEAVDYNG